jgi:hypothetical protein
LVDFDPEAIEQHNVTAWDVESAYRYVALLPGTDSQTYADIAGGCYYGTSALLHEVVEVRILLERDRQLLTRSRREIKAFLQDNEDAHVEALKVEYVYLQQKVKEILGQEIGFGALLKANTISLDCQLLVESRLRRPIFEPTEVEIDQAAELLARLREVDKEAHK